MQYEVGHMNKMAAVPICEKISSRTDVPMALELGM